MNGCETACSADRGPKAAFEGPAVEDERVGEVRVAGQERFEGRVDDPRCLLYTSPNSYRTFAHGYAVTAHKSQGATVDHAIVAAEKLDGKSTYVASSRGRRTLEIHAPDRARLLREAVDTIESLSLIHI